MKLSSDQKEQIDWTVTLIPVHFDPHTIEYSALSAPGSDRCQS